MSEKSAEVKNDNSVETESQPQEEKPAGRSKRSAGKRVSMLARTAQEGEAILKGMGHKEEAPEGRRTTRSSSRGSTVSQPTPPPAKRERKTPSTGKGSRRGRPKKDEAENEDVETDESKSESKEETKEQEENGAVDEPAKKENSVDNTDVSGDSKPMEVDETPAPAEGDKPTDNGPAEQPSSPAKTQEETSKEEPEKAAAETNKEEVSKPESENDKKESPDTREAPPPQSD